MALEYLKKLELAARWRLPPEEAEETAADYREMLEERPEEPPENRWANAGTPADRQAGARPAVARRLWQHGSLRLFARLLADGAGAAPQRFRLSGGLWGGGIADLVWATGQKAEGQTAPSPLGAANFATAVGRSGRRNPLVGGLSLD